MIILLLKILGLAWIITGFAPISWLVDLLPDNLFKYIVVLLTSCFKCCSLWVGIAMGGIWVGILSSFIANAITLSQQTIQTIYLKKLNKNG